jgi:hypothetical protein
MLDKESTGNSLGLVVQGISINKTFIYEFHFHTILYQ